MHFTNKVAREGGADLKLGLQAVDGCRHTPGHSISQSCRENKRPPGTKTRRLLGELDGHRTALTHIKNLNEESRLSSVNRARVTARAHLCSAEE